MTVWEYKVVEKWGQPFNSQEMNKFGMEGWELVNHVESYETVKGSYSEALRYFIFKRPKKN